MRRAVSLLCLFASLFAAVPALAAGGTSQNWIGWARRSWQPTDVKAVSWVLNLNATAAQMTLVSSTHVSVWNDQSGLGNNGTQGTDASRFIYNATGGPGNLPFVAFSNATCPNVGFADVFSSLTAGEVFVVRKMATDPGNGSFMKFGTAVAADAVPGNDGIVVDGFGSNLRKTAGDPATDLSQWHIYNVTTAPSLWTLRFNGVQFFTTATNTVGFRTAAIFGHSIAACSDGGASTIWLANGAMNSGDRAAMTSWLNRRWLLGLAL